MAIVIVEEEHVNRPEVINDFVFSDRPFQRKFWTENPETITVIRVPEPAEGHVFSTAEPLQPHR